ncbi:starch synthase [Clostridium acetobutylicum]|uniref:Glycogen synthase n=1 Tax=Clostridium acetobutylicum (strain ATCC 824 / DSM 792 / JCM 1419 / IAM 19013 / LMG 5710 / NBRC 13948 / NRRL B-527 / VKM B-1787 / 2291 / W) TaxID=272562 RepID=GLGA_CLOAB|nr:MULTISPECIES: glycogen synthase GlgA [Clostridium]Q97GX6.1 RecName: Full=Glycogen synthase; AltName: Full=Starch [bacterial glycogen] synthase [Clostridium acetobutylicum ATCC 824]AAK80196.1 Glycogen synthase, glgA [Clostridium acetobutylicum ATCC 824]ADZ21290.1 Glycogen synthase, glgA [Clostridium acetobutylicum EA 2018]AEI33735.1 glycogen synthase [Clostridium acetobutylicum DSM 1731]AWV79379.1 glycogen synthase GlgA [Clostridium acetobutylicum]MBC2394650.1 glycogen synthase GlgA [Clostr
MKILFASSESYPFIKTGGLGDVSYALPKALRKIGIDARVIIPKYSDIPEYFRYNTHHIASFGVPVGWRSQYGGLEYYEYDGVPFYFIDNDYYFKRSGLYGYYDDGERFAYFSRGVLQAITYMQDFNPDIIQCNDWQTAIIPVLLKDHYRNYRNYNHIKTIFTIHNLKYQGVFGKSVLGELLCLNEGYYNENALKFYDGISFMKGGILFSDKLSTVSRTYAEEIKDPYYGEHLDGLLRSRSYDLWGIVNGIDYDILNPETDKDLFFNFDSSTLYNKTKNKIELQKMLNLPVSENIPMIGIVSRLVSQKGLDLISCVLEDLLQDGIQLVVLGTGDAKYENMFKYFAWKYPNKLSANIQFNNSLAQKIYGASDMFLMPSKFEPCGIGQLIALRYGSLPIVRETGGLKDTVRPFNPITGEGNGFSFTNYNAHDMLHVIRNAEYFYYNEKYNWNKLVQTAMNDDNSWSKSAEIYRNLYMSVL